MSYYTSHTLKVLSQVDEKIEINQLDLIADLRNTSDEAEYSLDENGDCEQSSKWHEHEKDLRAFSKKYPKLIFELHGEGEESGDIWKEYYQDGKMQKCKAEIVYPDFDPSKLI